jgi:hypothetical protein
MSEQQTTEQQGNNSSTAGLAFLVGAALGGAGTYAAVNHFAVKPLHTSLEAVRQGYILEDDNKISLADYQTNCQKQKVDFEDLKHKYDVLSKQKTVYIPASAQDCLGMEVPTDVKIAGSEGKNYTFRMVLDGHNDLYQMCVENDAEADQKLQVKYDKCVADLKLAKGTIEKFTNATGAPQVDVHKHPDYLKLQQQLQLSRQSSLVYRIDKLVAKGDYHGIDRELGAYVGRSGVKPRATQPSNFSKLIMATGKSQNEAAFDKAVNQVICKVNSSWKLDKHNKCRAPGKRAVFLRPNTNGGNKK